MGVDALCLVVLVVKGAPLCFEMMGVELETRRVGQVVQQAHVDILSRVRKGAVCAVFTLLFALENRAEFGFIFILVVEALHSVVGSFAQVSKGALVAVCELAKFRQKYGVFSTPIPKGVVVETCFVLVILGA